MKAKCMRKLSPNSLNLSVNGNVTQLLLPKNPIQPKVGGICFILLLASNIQEQHQQISMLYVWLGHRWERGQGRDGRSSEAQGKYQGSVT